MRPTRSRTRSRAIRPMGLAFMLCLSTQTDISCFNAIETPNQSASQCASYDGCLYSWEYQRKRHQSNHSYHQRHWHHALRPWLGGTAYANYLWLNPTFSMNAGVSGSGMSISFPSESWHGYQLQYKNALTDSSWSNLGGLVGGNDTLQTISDSTSATNRFYRIGSF